MRGARKMCWNCGSTNFTETISVEECRSCGIRCYYHGTGANEAYNQASAAKQDAETERLEQYWDAYYTP